jgi:hypothetical protein
MTYPDNYKSACWRRKILSAHLTVVRVVYGIGIGRENLIQEVEDTVYMILALFLVRFRGYRTSLSRDATS